MSTSSTRRKSSSLLSSKWSSTASFKLRMASSTVSPKLESLCDTSNAEDARVSNSALDAADIGGVEVGFFGKCFLRKLFCFTHLSYIQTKSGEYGVTWNHAIVHMSTDDESMDDESSRAAYRLGGKRLFTGRCRIAFLTDMH